MTEPSAVAPATAKPIPWLGLLAVLMGTFISTLNGRLSTFGLADIRGALHAGFDEGAWITTAQAVGQMFIAPVAVWVGGTFGPRQALLAATTAFTVVSVAIPFSTDLPMMLALQFASGLASGFFIPLTLSYVLRSTAPRFWAYGIAIYALNLELSLNISASLEGWYVDHLSWHWIFWQNVPLGAVMALCLALGVGRDPPHPKRPPANVYGLLSAGFGLALVYAGLDQGNRLDWLNSGVVTALLASGAVLIAAFLVHEARTPHPVIDLRSVFGPPISRLLILTGFLRLTTLATSYLIPQYLQNVRGFRALEVGDTLLWIAAPQLILCPIAAAMMRRIDPRFVICIGFLFISVACLMVARGLTPLWGSDQFLATQLLQAIGQSFALSGVIFFGILHLRPEAALTFGSALQTGRLLGGECGLAFVTTLSRVRGQTASNTIGQHVQAGTGDVLVRLQSYGRLVGSSDPGRTAARALAVLGNAIRSAATTQGIIDAFVAVGALTAVALLFAVAHRAAPVGPASHVPISWRRRGPS